MVPFARVSGLTSRIRVISSRSVQSNLHERRREGNRVLEREGERGNMCFRERRREGKCVK